MKEIRKYMIFIAVLSMFTSGNYILAMDNKTRIFAKNGHFEKKSKNHLYRTNLRKIILNAKSDRRRRGKKQNGNILSINGVENNLSKFRKFKSDKELKKYSKELDIEFNEVLKKITGKNPLIIEDNKYKSPNDILSDAQLKGKDYGIYSGKDLYKVVAGHIASSNVAKNGYFTRVHIDNLALNNADCCWKIHISPNVLFCSEVLKLVDELHSEMKFSYKVVSSLPLYRRLNSHLDSQYGKFITIYPKDDSEARIIADKLNCMFIASLPKYWYLEVPNDFRIYPGISCRLAYCGQINDEEEEEDDYYRKHLEINPNLVEKQAAKFSMSPNKYNHPFEALYAKNRKISKEEIYVKESSEICLVKISPNNEEQTRKQVCLLESPHKLMFDNMIGCNINVKNDELDINDVNILDQILSNKKEQN